MSNRRRPRGLTSEKMRKMVKRGALNKVDIPRDEQVVVKRVPAKIKWALVGNIDRDDVETIGETVIYDDDTFDLIVDDNCSDEAKTLIYGSDLFQYSIANEEE